MVVPHHTAVPIMALSCLSTQLTRMILPGRRGGGLEYSVLPQFSDLINLLSRTEARYRPVRSAPIPFPRVSGLWTASFECLAFPGCA